MQFITPPQATKGNTCPFTRGRSEPAPSCLNTKPCMTSSPATPKGSGSSSKLSTPPHKASLTGSAKKQPNQMQVQDYPKEFTGTKEALNIHIKVMWGMVEANLPLPPVDQRLLEVFNMSFNNAKQVKLTVENTAAESIHCQDISEILTLKQGCTGAIKLGCGMLYLDDFAICTIYSHLAHLGIYLWGLDLTESPDSLYNIACQLACLKSVQEVAVNGPYLNVNKTFLNNLTLLIPAYCRNAVCLSDNINYRNMGTIPIPKGHQHHPFHHLMALSSLLFP
ncbi:hypothetical protein CROQUDRAFT_685875 [Cronartium quercuum f. sp. fusiforme G11]|uniref:Uncharacterized protein n=1 Tax=Cronartium quercuum f. sp. fusiforme G11 TaxID=708437 RepID=A0A9P6NCC2_9BASI|nr:hypothetical protein CROQUDRAFT_685875 [Cronartium quercuum f. sp. fusiforme G11]